MSGCLVWLIFIFCFVPSFYILASLVYAGSQTDATFNALELIFFVVIIVSFFIIVFKPQGIIKQIREEIKEQKTKPRKPISKGWKITGIVCGIFDVVAITAFILIFTNIPEYPDKQEFYELHKDEKYVCYEYSDFKGTEQAKWEIEFVDGQIKYAYYTDGYTYFRHISWKVREMKDDKRFLGEFFKKQQFIFTDPFKDRAMFLDIIYEKDTGRILRMENDYCIFLPEGTQ